MTQKIENKIQNIIIFQKFVYDIKNTFHVILTFLFVYCRKINAPCLTNSRAPCARQSVPSAPHHTYSRHTQAYSGGHDSRRDVTQFETHDQATSSRSLAKRLPCIDQIPRADPSNGPLSPLKVDRHASHALSRQILCRPLLLIHMSDALEMKFHEVSVSRALEMQSLEVRFARLISLVT